MGHYYDEEIAKAAEELRDRIKKGQVATVTTYEDFYEGAHASEELVVELFKEEYDYPLVEGLPNYQASLKETTGKPKGARYCYLGENAIISNKNRYHNLERLLADLVNCVDEKAFASAGHICEIMLQEVRDLDDNFLNNLVTVRAHALSTGKYTLDSYREEIPVELLLDATARHLLKILYVSDIDEESGVHHLGHIAANLIMIDVQLRLYHE